MYWSPGKKIGALALGALMTVGTLVVLGAPVSAARGAEAPANSGIARSTGKGIERPTPKPLGNEIP